MLTLSRCHRLRKPCSPQTQAPSRKRARKDKQAVKKRSRVEILEDRIEQLSSRLVTADDSYLTAHSSSTILPEPTLNPNTPFETHRESTASHGAWLALGEPSIPQPESVYPVSHAPSERALLSSVEILRQTQKSVMKAQTREIYREKNAANKQKGDRNIEALLYRYRTHMQHRFPFVIVPEELSNEEERQQRPFLWRAVKVAALWQEHGRHIKLGKRLLIDFTDAILLRPLKSFDVVQGLLIFIAW